MSTTRPIRLLLLLLALASGFTLRAANLDSYGFSEDEVAKLRAVDAYRHGDLSANAEHPMLMKLAVWGALSVADTASAHGLAIAPETALRAPNVIAGTVAVAVVGAAAALLFSPWVGVTAALLVAFDPNVIAINRIGKEDTFLVLFFFVAVWCYERAKRIGLRDLPRARHWFTAAGAAFGLMLASKYMPHLLGLFALFNVVHNRDAGPICPDKRRYYAAMGAAFVLGNVAILLPSTWEYCLAYVRGRHLSHHGLVYAGQLYSTGMLDGGLPYTFYLRLIATKVPLAVLAAALAGVMPLVRRRRERGFVWLRVMLVFLVLGYSVAAAKFQRYSLPMLVLIDILAAVGLVEFIQWLIGPDVRSRLHWAGAAIVYATIVLAPLAASVSIQPFFSLHQNAIGAWLAPPAATFPEETYDYGVREAVAEIARTAGLDAAVISDAPGVVGHYVGRLGRPDLKVLSLSQAGITPRGEQWVIVQNEHLYFENRWAVARLRSGPRWRDYRLRDTPVLELYQLREERALAGPPPGHAVRSSPMGSS